MGWTGQQNVMPLYESGALMQDSFPCYPITAGVTLATSSRSTQAGRRADHFRTQISDSDLRRSVWMAAAQTGDGVAYQALLRECIPIIKNVARRRGVSVDRIDDVVQEVLLTVHCARQTYDPSRSFTVWLCVIADRRAIDLLRRIRRQDLREVHAPLAFEDHADQSADPTRWLVHTDTSGVVTRAIASLPPRQRQAVQHLVLEERSLADTAALTRRSAGSLKVNLHRALKALRDKIRPWD